MFPLDWCRGSQTLVDPEALPVLGELVEPDPAARPLPSLLAVICPPLWLTSPHDPPSLACPEGFQTRSATYLAIHLSLRQPTLLLESPWVSPGAEGTRDAPSRAAVWNVRPGGRTGRPRAWNSHVSVSAEGISPGTPTAGKGTPHHPPPSFLGQRPLRLPAHPRPHRDGTWGCDLVSACTAVCP